ncbi:MAG: hypothetical protein J6M39_06735 [Lachnospiraceae bacterium]|nr:hypothetical protein [Lachnospiraceae bacterium]
MLTTIPDNFIYFGLFLTDESREKLINFVQDNLKNTINKADKIYLEHITLLHKNDKHQFRFKFQMYCLLNYMFENFIGETYEVQITHIGFNDKAFAFKVELPEGFPMFQYKTYHITIGTFHRARPFESNTIISWHKLYEPITVTTILKKVIRDENF